MVVRHLVHGMGYRYRLHKGSLPGSPDLVFGPRRKVIFVHGCWFRDHGCGVSRHPNTNAEYAMMKRRGLDCGRNETASTLSVPTRSPPLAIATMMSVRSFPPRCVIRPTTFYRQLAGAYILAFRTISLVECALRRSAPVTPRGANRREHCGRCALIVITPASIPPGATLRRYERRRAPDRRRGVGHERRSQDRDRDHRQDAGSP